MTAASDLSLDAFIRHWVTHQLDVIARRTRYRLRKAQERVDELLQAAGGAGVEALEIGSAGGDRLSISAAERDLSVALADAERAWRSLGARLGAASPSA